MYLYYSLSFEYLEFFSPSKFIQNYSIFEKQFFEKSKDKTINISKIFYEIFVEPYGVIWLE